MSDILLPEKKINLYHPHLGQKQVIQDNKRFKVLSCGRRWGKTTLAINELLYYALLDSNTDYWYVAPTYSQAKTIAWRYLVQQYRQLPLELQLGKNESELWVEIGNHSRITLKGAENEDSLRGSKLGGLVIDEVASIKNFKYLWDEALRPALTDKKGWGLFISTPKGYNHFYELFTKNDPDYSSFHFSSYDNPFLEHSEIDKARQELTEDAFAQEYLADFRKFTGLVFKEFDREVHVINNIELPGSDSYYRALDFGAINPTVCLFIRVDSDGNAYIYDEYYQTERTTKDNAYAIQAKHPVTYFRATWGDPSGKQERLDYEQYGLHITPANKQVIDQVTGKLKDTQEADWIKHRINLIAERLKINPVTRKPRVFIGRNCVNTIREFESYRWEERKDKALNQTDQPVKADDHTIDALGYFMCSYAKTPKREFRQPPQFVATRIQPIGIGR